MKSTKLKTAIGVWVFLSFFLFISDPVRYRCKEHRKLFPCARCDGGKLTSLSTAKEGSDSGNSFIWRKKFNYCIVMSVINLFMRFTIISYIPYSFTTRYVCWIRVHLTKESLRMMMRLPRRLSRRKRMRKKSCPFKRYIFSLNLSENTDKCFSILVFQEIYRKTININ